MTANRIESVSFEEEYVIAVRLQNGQTVRFDMKPKLITARFHDLKDKEIFNRGRVTNAGRMIRWNGNTEITVEELIWKGTSNEENGRTN